MMTKYTDNLTKATRLGVSERRPLFILLQMIVINERRMFPAAFILTGALECSPFRFRVINGVKRRLARGLGQSVTYI